MRYAAMAAMCLALTQIGMGAADAGEMQLGEVVARYDFEPGTETGVAPDSEIARVVTGEEALSGEGSLFIDTRGREGEWFLPFSLPEGLLEANRRYYYSFAYKVLDRDDDAHFYCFGRSPSEQETNRWATKAYITWKGAPGDSGVQARRLTFGDHADLVLHLGVYRGARILIDDFVVRRLPDWDKAEILASARPASAAEAPLDPWAPVGMCTHPGMPWVYTDDDHARTAMRMLADAGCQWVRIGAGWSILEPERGAMREDVLHRIDIAVDEANARGMQAYIQLLGTPRWCSSAPDHERYWAHKPTDMGEWRRHVREMAEHFRGRVRHFEVWNEMDWEFWESPLEDFVPLLAAACEELKAVDPDYRVVLGGLSTDGVHPWENPRAEANALQRLYDAGAGPHFDILSIHPYPSDVTVGAFESIDKINAAYSVMHRNGDGDKPIWVTELGVSTNLNESSGFALSLEQQAQFLRDVMTVLPLHPKVEKVFWYNFRCTGEDPHDQEHHFGIVGLDFSPRPAYEALREVEKPTARRVAPQLLERDPAP